MTQDEKLLSDAMTHDAFVHAKRNLARFPDDDPTLRYTPEYNEAVRSYRRAKANYERITP